MTTHDTTQHHTGQTDAVLAEAVRADAVQPDTGRDWFSPLPEHFDQILFDIDHLCLHNNLSRPAVEVVGHTDEPAEPWWTGDRSSGLYVAPELADPQTSTEARTWFLARALAALRIGRPSLSRAAVAGFHHYGTAGVLLALIALWLTGYLPPLAVALAGIGLAAVRVVTAAVLRRRETRIDDVAARLVAVLPDSTPLDMTTALEVDTDSPLAWWHPWRTLPSPRQRLNRYGPTDPAEPDPTAQKGSETA